MPGTSDSAQTEWLIFQTALQVSLLESGALRALLPFVAAMLALTGALAAACFVKVFGLAFLGVARSRHVRRAREVELGMRAGQALLAVCCLAFGVLAVPVVNGLRPAAELLLGSDLGHATAGGWLWLTPVSPAVASYSAPLVLLGVALAGVAISLTRHRQRRLHPVRRSLPWDCGFGGLGPRMQYTSASFSMPFRRIFAPLWHVHESIERLPPGTLADGDRPLAARHTLLFEDRVWGLVYQPVTRWIHWTSRQVARLQTGRIRGYLVQSFVTLLVLLWVVS